MLFGVNAGASLFIERWLLGWNSVALVFILPKQRRKHDYLQRNTHVKKKQERRSGDTFNRKLMKERREEKEMKAEYRGNAKLG